MIMASTSVSCQTTAAPTLPRAALHRVLETPRICSTGANPVVSSRFTSSGSIGTWLGNERRVEVTGTTKIVVRLKRRNESDARVPKIGMQHTRA
jgi:hypothetical protein